MSRGQIKQAWLIVGIIVLMFANACFGIYNYLLRSQYQKREIIIKNIAKKDSIKAKIADTRLINVARPDSVKVLPATGQTVLYINNNRLSNSPITNIPGMPSSEESSVKEIDTEEAKAHADVLRLRMSLNRMKIQCDSLYNANLALQGLTAKKVTPTIIVKADTSSAKPIAAPLFEAPYFIGMRQNKSNSKMPKWSLSLRGSANYSVTRHAFSTGLGIQGSFKNTSLFGLTYYDWTTKQWRVVTGVQQDFIRITSSKK